MTHVITPSKSVFFSSIQIASFISISFIMTNLVLRPFSLSIGEFSHDEVTAMALVGMNAFVMIQRLKPQSKLYFIKEKVNEIVAVIEEAQSQDDQSSSNRDG